MARVTAMEYLNQLQQQHQLVRQFLNVKTTLVNWQILVIVDMPAFAYIRVTGNI